jgi:DNA-directed RNA polymerase subunit E'/Rpb7
MAELFVRSVLQDVVLLRPEMIGSNFREMVQHKLRETFEGVCSRHGYILPGSITVHRILSARIEAVSLNGDVRYDVRYFANVCNPAVGAVVEARIVNMNKFGVLAHSGVQGPDGEFLPVVESIVMRLALESNPNEVDLDTLAIGDSVFVEIVGRKFELNDERISVIARAVKGAGSLSHSPSAPAPALGALTAGASAALMAGDHDDHTDGEEDESPPSEGDDDEGDEDVEEPDGSDEDKDDALADEEEEDDEDEAVDAGEEEADAEDVGVRKGGKKEVSASGGAGSVAGASSDGGSSMFGGDDESFGGGGGASEGPSGSDSD